MLALIIGTFFSAGFGLVMRHAQEKQRNLWAVGVINYATATLFQLGRYLASGGGAVTWGTVGAGVIAGVLYGLNFWFYFSLMRHRGVSITNAMGRLAVLVPILVGVLVWGQRLDAVQGSGVALAVVALPLLTLRPSDAQKLEPSAIWYAVALLAGNGLSMMVIEAHEHLVPDASGPAFLAVLFFSAGIVATCGWWRVGRRISVRDIPHGVALGLTNALANAGLVAALAQLPGVIVFPFYSAVGLVLVALAARWLWQEEMGQLEMGGMAATLAAVVLMNLK